MAVVRLRFTIFSFPHLSRCRPPLHLPSPLVLWKRFGIPLSPPIRVPPMMIIITITITVTIIIIIITITIITSIDHNI